jgi:[ribosomal protein S5]-alanine N-acetyltransferase
MPAPPRSDLPTISELPLVISTPQLRLRPVTEADAEALFPFVSDVELPRYMSWAPHSSIDETRGWTRHCAAVLAAGSSVVWAIEHAGNVIGCAGLHDIRWTLRALRIDRAELGYWIGRPHWGRGLMTEAAAAVTAWAFDTLGLHKVRVKCFEPNIASRRVIEKCGFRFIGVTEDDVWRDGQWYAHLEYERVRP